MDTSETYIKMCEKAEEIQVATNYQTNYAHLLCTFVNKKSHSFQTIYNYKHSENIWLPTQSQLQEMVGDCNNPYPTIKKYVDFALNYKRLDGGEWIMTSMEQLWLAFVMKEKYNKVWNGEDWVDG